MNKLAFLEGDTPEPEIASEPLVEATAEGPARGADGKFVSAEPEAPLEAPVEASAAEPALEAAPVVETPPVAAPVAAEPVTAPLTALLDERDKRQKLEAELAALRAKQAQAAESEPFVMPNPAEDPEGYHRAVQQQLADQAFSQTMGISRRFAIANLGQEKFEAIHNWAFARCAEDPHFNAQVKASDDPYSFAKQHYDQAQILATVQPSELDEFAAWKAAKAAAAAEPLALAPVALTPTPTPPKPPASLVTAASAGGKAGSAPAGPGQAFSEVFSPR